MAITQGNLGIVKNNLQLYYNRESVKSFRGEATTNIVTADYDNFENVVGSYNAVSCTATRTNELFYFGDYSLKVVRSSSGADGYLDMEGYINVSASTAYTYNNDSTIYSITNANATFNNGFCVIGAYHNGGTGTNSGDSSQYWGKISKFIYYNRQLSSAEISQVYSVYKNRFSI